MQRTEPSAIITFDRVSYAYPNQQGWALSDISLRVRRGEFLGVVGATGSGKSTLCLALNGIVPQFYGGKYFGHLDVAGMDSLDTPVNVLAQQVGMVFENPEMQLTAVTVQAEVAFALENAGIAPDEMRRRIPEALHWVGLGGMETRHPSELSGGQQQRLAIAAALALHPPILVLDEPSSQLDPWATRDLFNILTTLNRTGITIIIVSHAAELLAAHCDRIAVLDQGHLVAVGAPGVIYECADLMSQARIRPPQVTQVFHNLAQNGINIPSVPVTLGCGSTLLRDMLGESKPIDDTVLRKAVPGIRETTSLSNSIAATPAIQAHGLSFAYDDAPVLQDIDVTIDQGEYVLLAGQNGAGKTTLLKHFLGLLRPNTGKVMVHGDNIADFPVAKIARTIGFISQNPDRQLFCNTVSDEIRFGLEAQRLEDAEIQARMDENLSRLELTNLQERHPLSLTRAERTRVVIAAMLALEPDILVFDEPTVGQDHNGAAAILTLSKQIQQAGKTVIVVTHHLHLMPEYAQRVLVLHQGRIIFDGQLRDAYHNSEMLCSAKLIPPQAVQLTQSLGEMNNTAKLLTPTEIVSAITRQMREGVR